MTTKKTTPRKRRTPDVEIIDVAAEGEKCRRTARKIQALLADDHTPDYLRTVISRALEEASAARNFPAPDGRWPASDQLELLADLVAVTRGDFSLDKTPPSDVEQFAHHLSEAIRIARNSDDIPTDIYNALGDLNNDYITSGLKFDSAEVIALALETYIALGLETYQTQTAERAGK